MAFYVSNDTSNFIFIHGYIIFPHSSKVIPEPQGVLVDGIFMTEVDQPPEEPDFLEVLVKFTPHGYLNGQLIQGTVSITNSDIAVLPITAQFEVREEP